MSSLPNFKKIKAFIFDVDGVFTDNRLIVTEKGELLRTMNARDGYAIKMALKHNYHVAIITGGNSKGVKLRLQGLGIADIYLGIKDKLSVLKEHLAAQHIKAEDCLYMGDDIIDLQCIQYTGIGACPSDSVSEVLASSNYVSPQQGGNSCVRDVVELVLKSQANWVS